MRTDPALDADRALETDDARARELAELLFELEIMLAMILVELRQMNKGTLH